MMKSIKITILFLIGSFFLSCADEVPSVQHEYFGEWNLDCSCQDNTTPETDDIVLEYPIWIQNGGDAGQVSVTNIHESGGIDMLFVNVLGPTLLEGTNFQAEVHDGLISIHYIYYNFDCEAIGSR